MSREGHGTIPILAVPCIIGLKFLKTSPFLGGLIFGHYCCPKQKSPRSFCKQASNVNLSFILARCLTIFVSKADKISLTGSFDFRSVIHLSSLYECAAMKKLERSRLQERNKYEKEILSFSLMYLSG